MRISTGQIYETSAANYQRNYAKYIKSGEEVSSETKLNTASDDPIGAARVLQLNQQNSLLTQYAANINTVNTNGANSETALKSIEDALQTARELVIKGGNGAYTDADRLSTANELRELQKTILGLMNTQDASGLYLFSGSDGSQPPYSTNSDGSYSYHGNQTSVGLAVGEGLSLASNVTGWEAFEQAVNTTRTTASLTSSTTDNGKVGLTASTVSSTSTYNATFLGGEPYEVSFVSGPKLLITDKNGVDVTSDSSTAGSFQFNSGAAQTITFRGVDLTLNINLSAAESASAAAAETALQWPATQTRTYTLESTPPAISTARSPGNTSTATITKAEVGQLPADKTAFNNVFPAAGARLEFSVSGGVTTYELYAMPKRAGDTAFASGTGAGPTIKAGGVEFTISGTPQNGDTFVVESNTHQTQNVLNTLSDIITAFSTPADGNLVATQKMVSAVTSALGNLTSGTEQVSTAISAIGSRMVAAQAQGITNDLLKGNNQLESDSFTKADPFESASRMTLQKTMLDASQQVFLQTSKLSLFSML
ncbi:flagellar hook-associated protein 3 [Pseudomonas sp. 21LCFQ010]|uniref:flagellar hook-associated protein 3 n=1 Tax=Pseudomonas sp. 21LCFQ010 TaxID=2957506 RepID=UPI0020977D77|nr:flagellar hook-associated protein 3 [Pseudomonas sp. 21LCFQ010]MCO8163423.1 flagellar hook-associated protein 3 [Pseudomonas sp. 21LCFQ010]